VDEHHVNVYASKKNTGEIIKAPRPKDLFRNSIATPALVAAILNAKYSLAIPYEKPVILYDWQPSRRADHPRDFMKSFSGVVVTDGYLIYHKISRERKDLAYSINQEQYLRTFLSDPGVPMDNNIAEQAIRPFTVGRKNFVLIESDRIWKECTSGKKRS